MQRSIDADTSARRSMGTLVWADVNRSYQRPASPPTRPNPVSPQPFETLNSGAPVSANVSDTAKQPAQKGAPHA